MITKASSLFLQTRSKAGFNDKRVRVLIGLLQSRMPIEEIAEVLNCDDTIVRSLLVQPYLSLFAGAASFPKVITEPISLADFPPRQPAVVERSSPEAREEPSRHLEQPAQHLFEEVCEWLGTFDVSNSDRQKAIEEAGILLNESSVYWAGKYLFSVERAILEIRGAWRPWLSNPADREIPVLAGRRMASWIRFWIAEPDVWDRALDLAFAHFGMKAQAAA